MYLSRCETNNVYKPLNLDTSTCSSCFLLHSFMQFTQCLITNLSNSLSLKPHMISNFRHCVRGTCKPIYKCDYLLFTLIKNIHPVHNLCIENLCIEMFICIWWILVLLNMLQSKVIITTYGDWLINRYSSRAYLFNFIFLCFRELI